MGTLRKIRKMCGSLHPATVTSQPQGRIERMDLDKSELEAILERAKTTPMSEEEYAKLHAAIETLVFLTQELEKKQVSVQRLKQLLFGATTETTRKVMERILDEAGKERTSGDEAAEGKEPEVREKAPGHGRHGAEEYVGAEEIWVPRCMNCRSCGATCVARSSRPRPRRAWEPRSTTPNRRA